MTRARSCRGTRSGISRRPARRARPSRLLHHDGHDLDCRAAIDTRGIGFVTRDYASYDDYLLYLTIALDWRFSYEPRTVMRYRRHQGNLTNVLFQGTSHAHASTCSPTFSDGFPKHGRASARSAVASSRAYHSGGRVRPDS